MVKRCPRLLPRCAPYQPPQKHHCVASPKSGSPLQAEGMLPTRFCIHGKFKLVSIEEQDYQPASFLVVKEFTDPLFLNPMLNPPIG
jgi:hypothetical protein